MRREIDLALDDRHALNVRREGLALADRLISALSRDDIPAVARILDRGASA